MQSKKPDTTLLFELEISSRLISKKFSATAWLDHTVNIMFM